MYFNDCIDVSWYNYRNCGIMKKILKHLLVFSLCLYMCLSSVTPVSAYTIKVNSTKYGYSTLSKGDKKIYKKILVSINDMSKRVDFPKYKNTKHLFDLYKIVLADNPDIFWLDSKVSSYIYTSNNKVVKSSLGFNYTYSKAKKEKVQKKIETKTAKILKNMPKSDDYAKAKYLYETVADLVEYDDYDTNNSKYQQMVSALLNGESVCAGYTKMYNYLLQKAGLQAMYVSGKVYGQSHAWSLVRVNGQYYYSDVTFGDKEGKDLSYHDYTYFLEPLSDMSKDHVLNKSLVKLPSAKKTDYEYFQYEDLYFTKFAKEERAWVDEKLNEDNEDMGTFQIKCNVEYICKAFRNYLYTKNNVIGISVDDDRQVMTVFYENLSSDS